MNGVAGGGGTTWRAWLAGAAILFTVAAGAGAADGAATPAGQTATTMGRTAATSAAAATSGAAPSPAAAPLQVTVTPNTAKCLPRQLFELTFLHQPAGGPYADPDWDVTVEVVFTAPSGRKLSVGGFFYGSSRPQPPVLDKSGDWRKTIWPCDPADTWKARYAPSEIGDWRYEYTFRNQRGQSAAGRGFLKVVPPVGPVKGWIKVNPKNPLRLAYEDGSPFWPVGFQRGLTDANSNGSLLDQLAMEGPFRLLRKDQPSGPMPAGAMFVRGPAAALQNGDVYFGRLSRAGFNLWRFSPHNSSPKVFASAADPEAATLDHVRWEQARQVDELLQMSCKYGLRNFYGIFGNHQVFGEPDKKLDPRQMATVKRIIKYSVDRWGAYVDFWELVNEQKLSDAWYREAADYLKSVDPYGKLVSTSWERPDLKGIDLNAPHWFGNENELNADSRGADLGRERRSSGKPVIFGEQGNNCGREDRSRDGTGGVWDPASARRMRARLWGAFFSEAAFVFRENSWARDASFMGLWIGPEERQYVKAWRSFVELLDADVKIVDWTPLEGPQSREVRAHSLRSARQAAVYLHHRRCAICETARQEGKPVEHVWSHQRGLVKDLKITIDVPEKGRGYWYDPATGNIVDRFRAAAGKWQFAAPPFEVDLALFITPDSAAPDSDHDGSPNDIDADDDNDGVPDTKDAWPLEREESADADGDRIGDALDADVDADGRADDLNRDKVPDNEELDSDGDRAATSGAVPWDAFPRDRQECRDSDGDGQGDQADPDADGDGYPNDEERRAGSDPLNALSFP